VLVNRFYLSYTTYTTYTTYSTPLIGHSSFLPADDPLVGRRESRLPLTQVFLCQPPSSSRFWLLIFGESNHRLQGLRNL
jgi:hypothetical protein